MRRQGPAVSLARITTKDVVLQGQHIPCGSMLCLLICAANLDPDIFPDPGKFDIQRSNANRHLSVCRTSTSTS